MGCRLLPLLVALATLTACSVGDVLPSNHDTASPASPAAPPPTPAAPTAKPLDGAHLARRLALDLALSLPVPQDVALLTADLTKFPLLVDTYLASGGAGRALAGLQPRMWHLDSRSLPDLDALATPLTPAERLQIVQEPSLLVRHAIEHHLPFSSVFTASYDVTSAPLLGLWGLTTDSTAFVGESYVFATYPDSRPAAGLLDSPAFLAGYASRNDPALRQRTAVILDQLLCVGLENPAAHAFSDLTAAELKQDLGTLAATRAPCSGCHVPLDGAAAAWAGLGSTTPFSSWMTYTAPAKAVQGDDGGQTFTGLDGLASAIGSDPRSGRCELTRLAQAIYQRPLVTEADSQAIAQAADALGNEGGDLAKAARPLFLSPEYSYGVISPDLKGAVLRQSSGVRVLGLAQWQGILAQLAPGAVPADLTDDLDPGHDEAFTGEDGVPTGAYWHRVDRLAREAASKIVATELAAGVPATARRVLTDLPDGDGSTASAAVVQQQLIDLWKLLTGTKLAATDAKLQSLLTLWNAAQPGTDAADFQRAWRTVLVAVLTDPGFLTY